MNDPKPTIKLASCREDGRCPECGGLYDSTLMHSHDLPCGCVAVGMSCAELHLRALLTEALRQLSDQQERTDEANRKWLRYEDAYILPCFARAEAAGIDLHRLVSERAGQNCVEILVDTLREERDAAIRRNAALKEHLKARHGCDIGEEDADYGF